jgi:hypothetical protein
MLPAVISTSQCCQSMLNTHCVTQLLTTCRHYQSSYGCAHIVSRNRCCTYMRCAESQLATQCLSTSHLKAERDALQRRSSCAAGGTQSAAVRRMMLVSASISNKGIAAALAVHMLFVGPVMVVLEMMVDMFVVSWLRQQARFRRSREVPAPHSMCTLLDTTTPLVQAFGGRNGLPTWPACPQLAEVINMGTQHCYRGTSSCSPLRDLVSPRGAVGRAAAEGVARVAGLAAAGPPCAAAALLGRPALGVVSAHRAPRTTSEHVIECWKQCSWVASVAAHMRTQDRSSGASCNSLLRATDPIWPLNMLALLEMKRFFVMVGVAPLQYDQNTAPPCSEQGVSMSFISMPL